MSEIDTAVEALRRELVQVEGHPDPAFAVRAEAIKAEIEEWLHPAPAVPTEDEIAAAEKAKADADAKAAADAEAAKTK